MLSPCVPNNASIAYIWIYLVPRWIGWVCSRMCAQNKCCLPSNSQDLSAMIPPRHSEPNRALKASSHPSTILIFTCALLAQERSIWTGFVTYIWCWKQWGGRHGSEGTSAVPLAHRPAGRGAPLHQLLRRQRGWKTQSEILQLKRNPQGLRSRLQDGLREPCQRDGSSRSGWV